MRRITKREAFQRFCNGLSFVLCPCKMHPEYPWNMGYHVPAFAIINFDWVQIEQTPKERWDSLYANWAFYNCTWETGYYAHYYVD